MADKTDKPNKQEIEKNTKKLKNSLAELEKRKQKLKEKTRFLNEEDKLLRDEMRMLNDESTLLDKEISMSKRKLSLLSSGKTDAEDKALSEIERSKEKLHRQQSDLKKLRRKCWNQLEALD